MYIIIIRSTIVRKRSGSSKYYFTNDQYSVPVRSTVSPRKSAILNNIRHRLKLGTIIDDQASVTSDRKYSLLNGPKWLPKFPTDLSGLTFPPFLLVLNV